MSGDRFVGEGLPRSLASADIRETRGPRREWNIISVRPTRIRLTMTMTMTMNMNMNMTTGTAMAMRMG